MRGCHSIIAINTTSLYIRRVRIKFTQWSHSLSLDNFFADRVIGDVIGYTRSYRKWCLKCCGIQKVGELGIPRRVRFRTHCICVFILYLRSNRNIVWTDLAATITGFIWLIVDEPTSRRHASTVFVLFTGTSLEKNSLLPRSHTI